MNNLSNNGTAVALGNFDGMHIGHVAVLNETWKFLHVGLVPCVVLFDIHSEKAILGEAPPMLMTNDERLQYLSDTCFASCTLKFNEIKDLSPQEFLSDILIKKLNAKAIICGYNYRFGKNASGSAETLKILCEKENIECRIVGEIDCHNIAVSSTEIRKNIENGNIEKANEMLGHDFGFASEVIHGDKRGRTWGFPTINQVVPEGLVMPKFGVYASKVTIDDDEYLGVTNIGKRPTIGTDIILSETNIIGFNKEIYGQSVDIRLIRFVRSENKFSSFDELAKQIDTDIQNVKRGADNV